MFLDDPLTILEQTKLHKTLQSSHFKTYIIPINFTVFLAKCVILSQLNPNVLYSDESCPMPLLFPYNLHTTWVNLSHK